MGVLMASTMTASGIRSVSSFNCGGPDLMVRTSDHLSLYDGGPAPHPVRDLAAVRPDVEHERAARPGAALAAPALGAGGARAPGGARLAAARRCRRRRRRLRAGLHRPAADHAAGRPRDRARARARDP